MKDIVIYPNNYFCETDSSVILQYYLASILDKMGINTKICNDHFNNKNSIFNKFISENEIDFENTIVIYTERVIGNPLKAKYVVRWILGSLEGNVSIKKNYSTWNKNELVYFFNSQIKFNDYSKFVDYNKYFKKLSVFYINNQIKNLNLEREGTCYTFRKASLHKKINIIHENKSFEITRHNSLSELIEIFNKHQMFISYDPLTFLNFIAAMCGCISIIYPVEGLTKTDYFKMTALNDYLLENKTDLYGIAYGNDENEILFAKNTVHLAKQQIEEIQQWFLDKYINNFIHDLENYRKNTNILSFYNKIMIQDNSDFDIIFYKNSNSDLANLSLYELTWHYENYGKKEGRFSSEKQMKEYINDYDFDIEYYRKYNPDLDHLSFIELVHHYKNYGKNEGRISSEKQMKKLVDDEDFDIDYYKKYNQDLHHLSYQELVNHYKHYGKNEGRFASEKQIKKIVDDEDFDIDYYKKNNPDLHHLSHQELVNHYKHYGKNEWRISSEKYSIFLREFYRLYKEFDFDYFIAFNPQLKPFDKKTILQYYYIYKNLNIFELNETYFNKVKLEVIDYKTYTNIKNKLEMVLYDIYDIYDIYDKNTFLNYYSNFDIHFYRKTYLSETNMSEMEVFIHYHTIGKKSNFFIRETTDDKTTIKNDSHLISIVMAYYNRKQQTLETLRGFQNRYVGKYNFEVIIVDDNSNEENRLEEDIKQFNFPINLIVINKEEKGDRINPCIAYNKGFKEAKGEIIIIQNSECYHVGDILNHTLTNLTEQDYFSYSCYSSNSYHVTNALLKSNNPYELICNKNFDDFNFGLSNLSWYNHPNIPGRDVGYHFCCSIYKSNLDLIGGFDERFAGGYCFDDDELLLSIKYNLKSNIKIINPENCFVIHQCHERDDSTNIEFEDESHPVKQKWLKNKKLYEEMKLYHETKKFNYPKLLHLYWDGSPLSFLNLITVLSFNEYHKFWKINVFIPEQKTDIITWVTHEQKIKYNGKCYFNKLSEIDNVFIHKVDLNKIGFYNEASEVIKSDYFRYYILQKHGGLWSDFDIIYTASVEDKMNFEEDNIIFHCTGFHDTIKKIDPFIYYPIGLFLCKNDSKFFKYILEKCNIYYDPKSYQSIGATMFNTEFKNYDDVYKIDNVKILDNTYYLYFQCNELKKLFVDSDEIVLPNNNVGIHWFNGSTEAKQYIINLDERLNDNSFEKINYIDNYVNKYKNINKHKNIALFTESSYPGGGGEEFMLDVAIYFSKQNYNVYWFSLHEWGKAIHDTFSVEKKKYYTEIKTPRNINDLTNYYYYKDLFQTYNINYLIHQGQGHKLICDLGNILNIPTITFWCFWEEAININWNYGLIDINKNLNKHNTNEDFLYIIKNIDFYYFASAFVKNTIEIKYNITIDNAHVFPTLSDNERIIKNKIIDSYYSEYITILDAHTLKGGKLFSELIIMNPNLSFLAIKTEDENEGPESIKQAINYVNNGKNIIYYNRINNIKEIYNKTKILLCPTQLDETFCRVVYESFQNKIPVIFSNCGNLSYINDENLLKINEHNSKLYSEIINKLISDKKYYDQIVEYQYNYYLSVKENSNIKLIEEQFIKIEKNKNKNIGIFTPWCDQGLGIQSRIYKEILEKMDYNVYIFSTKPYIKTNVNLLIKSQDEWETNNIYRSPNKRLEISDLELDLFVKNYKIKKMIIPEIQYDKIFHIATFLKQKYNILTYAIPNVECIRDIELDKFVVFEKVLTNNYMTYDILNKYNFKNIEYLGFSYIKTDMIKIDNINLNKSINNNIINILHLSGLNGMFRKRTELIVDIFYELYTEGIQNFILNIVIQGNFSEDKINIFDKPFINLNYEHLSYTQILNLYNDNHISIQISKQEGLGLGFYESCFMNTPVITLNAPPHNEIIHHNKNGWLLDCTLERDNNPENPFTIIEQTQVDKITLKNQIKLILTDINNINNVIKNTKKYTENLHNLEEFKLRLQNILED